MESEAVRSELQALGCDLAPGFLLGRPWLRDVRFNSLGGVLLGAVLLTILVSMRQFAALRDNAGWRPSTPSSPLSTS